MDNGRNVTFGNLKSTGGNVLKKKYDKWYQGGAKQKQAPKQKVKQAGQMTRNTFYTHPCRGREMSTCQQWPLQFHTCVLSWNWSTQNNT